MRQPTISATIKEVLPMSEFKEKYGQNANVEKELYVKDKAIHSSIRMAGRMLGVHNKELDRLQSIQDRTRKKRIKNKLGKRMYKILLNEIS